MYGVLILKRLVRPRLLLQFRRVVKVARRYFLPYVREVVIVCETMDLDALQWPIQRAARRFTSVEASCRLDAIASAGFGISMPDLTQLDKHPSFPFNAEAKEFSPAEAQQSAMDELDEDEVSMEPPPGMVNLGPPLNRPGGIRLRDPRRAALRAARRWRARVWHLPRRR